MRLRPLPADQWDEAVQRSLSVMLPPERCNPQDAGNALSTFANHPALAKAFLRFNVHLLYSSTLPPRIRELAILRVAHRRDCTYEWTHHVTLAKEAGLRDDEIAAVRRGDAAGEFERAVSADPSPRRLQPGDAVGSRRKSDRSSGIGSERSKTQTGGGGRT